MSLAPDNPELDPKVHALIDITVQNASVVLGDDGENALVGVVLVLRGGEVYTRNRGDRLTFALSLLEAGSDILDPNNEPNGRYEADGVTRKPDTVEAEIIEDE